MILPFKINKLILYFCLFVKHTFNSFRKILFFLPCIFLTISISHEVFGQANAEDCINAIPICKKLHSQLNISSDGGKIPDELPATCLSNGENNGFWYKIKTFKSGDIKFLIKPADNKTNFNWAIFDLGLSGSTLGCGAIKDRPEILLSCNNSKDISKNGETGATDEGIRNNQDENGTPYNAPISAENDHIYILYISSADQFPSQYDIDFSNSSAEFGNDLQPKVQTVFGNVLCQDTLIKILFNEYVNCGSLDADDFEILLPNGDPVMIKSIFAPVCISPQPDAFSEKEITLILNQPLSTTGDYTLRLKGEVTGACGTKSIPIDKKFSITTLLLFANAGADQLTCNGSDSLQLNAISEPILPNLNYKWNPTIGLSNPNIRNPKVLANTTTTYSLTVSSGDCISNVDEVTISVNDFSNVRFSGYENACLGEKIVISAVGAESFYWVDLDTTADLIELEVNSKMKLQVRPQSSGCTGEIIELNIQPSLPPIAPFSTEKLEVCENEIFTVRFEGVANDNVLYLWDFNNAFIKSGKDLGPFDIYFHDAGLKIITLKAISNGCTTIATRMITVYSQPEIEAGDEIWLCQNEGGAYLNAKVISGENPRFFWAPEEGLSGSGIMNPFASPQKTTTYTLFAVNSGGCRSEIDTVRVNVLPFVQTNILSPVVYSCYGTASNRIPATVEGGSGVYQYEWYPRYGLDNPFILQPIANPKLSTVYTLYVNDDKGCFADPKKIRVEVSPIPKANAGPDATICDGDVGVDLIGKAIGDQIGNYSYKWEPTTGLSDPFSSITYARPEKTTIYTLTVTHLLSGCNSQTTSVDSEAVAVVYVSQLPEPKAGKDRSICEGESSILGEITWFAGENVQIEWTPSEGLDDPKSPTPKARPFQTTNYKISVRSRTNNGKFCIAKTDSVMVNVLPLPIPYVTKPGIDVCPGDSVILSGGSGGGNKNVEYYWLPEDGLSNSKIATPKASPKFTTTYTLYAKSGRCEDPDLNDKIQVRVTKIPTIVKPSILPSGQILCLGDSMKLPIEVIGEPPFSVFWTTKLKGDTILNPNSIQATVLPRESNRYYIKVVKGNCAIFDSIDIKVVPKINLKVEIDTNEICQGDSITLMVTGGTEFVNYHWNDSSKIKKISKNEYKLYPDTTTSFILTADERGCIESKTINIIVKPMPKVKFKVNADTTCQDAILNFLNLTDEKGFLLTYLWDFGDGYTKNGFHAEHKYNFPGSFEVKLRAIAANGCSSEVVYQKRVIIYEKDSADFEFKAIKSPRKNTQNSMGQTFEFINKSSNLKSNFLWSFGDGQFSSLINPEHYYLDKFSSDKYPITYEVILTSSDSGGCVSLKKDTIIIHRSEEMIIPNIITPNGDGINDVWNIDYLGADSIKVLVWDRNGRKVFESTIPDEFWNGKQLNKFNDCAEGVYFYNITVRDSRFRPEKPKRYTGTVTIIR